MAKDDETGIDPKSKDGAGFTGGDEGDEVKRRREQKEKEATAAAAAEKKKTKGGSAKDRGADADASGEDEPDQTELPLDMPGAKKPTLSMNSRGKRVSVEGKMNGKSFKMSGVVDDPDQLIEVRALVRFEKDERVPVRTGSGETAQTSEFILRQHFNVLRMEIVDSQAAQTG